MAWSGKTSTARPQDKTILELSNCDGVYESINRMRMKRLGLSDVLIS